MLNADFDYLLDPNRPRGGFMCPQVSMGPPGMASVPMSEDCLYLDVYVPPLPDGMDQRSIPVLFWIYGGYFLCA